MLNRKIDFIAQKIGCTPSFLSLNLKFAGLDYRSGTQVLGESYVLNFSNERKRAVQVIFYSSEDESFFLVNIVNKETENTFSLGNWLKKKNILVGTDQFKLSSYAGDFEKKVESFSEYINSIFQNPDLYLIVNGDKWETIPFDWAGMR